MEDQKANIKNDNQNNESLYTRNNIIRKLRKVLVITGIGVSIILIGYQLYQSIIALNNGEMEFVNYWALVAAIFCMLVGILQQIDAWYILMKGIKIYMPFHDARVGYALSFLARYIPGSVWGYLSRGEWLNQRFGVRFVDASFSSILEILLSIIACVLIIGISWTWIEGQLVYIFILAIVIPVLSWILLQNRYSQRLLQKIFVKIKKNGATYSGIPFMDWITVLFLLAINWFYFGLALGLCGVVFDEWDILYAIKNILFFTRDFAIAWLAGFLVFFIPSGLGLRELIVGDLLSNQVGISTQAANTISITMRLVTSIAEITSVGVVIVTRFVWARIKNL